MVDSAQYCEATGCLVALPPVKPQAAQQKSLESGVEEIVTSLPSRADELGISLLPISPENQH